MFRPRRLQQFDCQLSREDELVVMDVSDLGHAIHDSGTAVCSHDSALEALPFWVCNCGASPVPMTVEQGRSSRTVRSYDCGTGRAGLSDPMTVERLAGLSDHMPVEHFLQDCQTLCVWNFLQDCQTVCLWNTTCRTVRSYAGGTLPTGLSDPSESMSGNLSY